MVSQWLHELVKPESCLARRASSGSRVAALWVAARRKFRVPSTTIQGFKADDKKEVVIARLSGRFQNPANAGKNVATMPLAL